ncbi:hypothetical protein COEREDRAFT_10121 [Coemansia reversa NRRL 1564]|uniref:Uncharacterized protein n=1 Tax=Coemansia reversa (strain ATCC 12441 / NRRL 1564) TaxID=763665 RepID=A0A2G5B6S8_COERN|nr:hypothetical protein COEREDRAFT_10121 [Coemansia reversa NRRL 1564]|eukprot:PIA14694.1 hypothetical protein COEREDRAFT_10121 [Coemansia reversa NRRL 1564]
MLKAFSKVFHKAQGVADEPTRSTTTEHPGGGPPSATKRVLERHRPVETGLGNGGADSREMEVHAPRSPPHRSGFVQASMPDAGVQTATELTKRVSLQHRIGQQVQPRLHLRAPPPGTDGRFQLTRSNIEWHLRMLPPVKESKYERILWYVQDQQQHVPAIADSMQTEEQGIDASVLMSGRVTHHDYADAAYRQAGLMHPQQPAPRAAFHSHLHPLPRSNAHRASVMTVLVPPRPSMGVQAVGEHDVSPNGEALHLAGLDRNATQQQTHHATVARADSGTGGNASEDNDDNTPLGAINHGALGQSSGNAGLGELGVTSLGKYMDGALDLPLSGPGVVGNGARMSMMSFHSTMAVNLNSDPPGGLSRSQSVSNPLSASGHDASSRRNTPVAPTPQDTRALRLSVHSSSARHSSPVSNALKARPSLDAITPSVPALAAEDDGFDDDTRPLAAHRPTLAGEQNAKPKPTAPSASGIGRPRAGSRDGSIEGVALRVVNRVSSGESEAEDDDQPLMSLGRRLSETHDTGALRVDAAARPTAINADDDDDQPLSALLFQPHATDDDLGSLPLPMPRRVVDPDAVADLNEMVNESAAPMRTGSAERSASPSGSLGVVRKKSLLSRTYTPGADNGRSGLGSDSPPHHPTKRRSRLRYSTPMSLHQSSVLEALVVTDPHNSLPRPAKTAGPISPSESTSSSSQDPPELATGTHPDGAGCPWLSNRQYSVSNTSVNSHRRACRGSTLGQQLTDELQKVREDIARSRRDYDRAVRRSWQVGDPLAVPQPWMRHESTLSDTALPQGSGDSTHAAAVLPVVATISRNNSDDIVTHSDAKLPSSWSFSEKQRPQSSQNYRVPRWLAKGPDAASRNVTSATSRLSHAWLPSKASASSIDAVAASAHPPIAGSSLSSRINNKFGKLKRTLKSGSSSADVKL